MIPVGASRASSIAGGQEQGETITWETASDWDSAVSESGVAHEDVPGTDHSDDTTIRKGYDYSSFGQITPDPLLSLPMHEDSGSTANDLSGNNNDGTYTGTTLGQTGLLGSTAPDFDGVDDVLDYPTVGISNTSFSVVVWANFDDFNDQTLWVPFEEYSIRLELNRRVTGEVYINAFDGSNQYEAGYAHSNLSTDSWVFLVGVYDGSTLYIYVNGVERDSIAVPSIASVNRDNHIGAYSESGGPGVYFNGNIAEFSLYNTALTNAEQQALYDVVNAESSLTTATKSFSSPTQPDLENLSYSLNGQTIDLDVIGSPGTGSEETVTQSLAGASSYTVSWGDSHTNFRIKPRLSTTDPSVTPTFSSASLVG